MIALLGFTFNLAIKKAVLNSSEVPISLLGWFFLNKLISLQKCFITNISL